MSSPDAEPAATAEPVQGSGTTVARASGIMAFSLTLSRVLGMLRDTAMTSAFGVSFATDAYRLAGRIPDLLFMLVAGGGLSTAFLPVFSELIHTNREKAAWKFFSVVVTLCSIIVAGLIALAWVFAPNVAYVLAKDKTDKHGVNISAQIIPVLTHMGRILLPAQFAFLIGSILLGTLYARRQFLAPSLAPNVYNVGIIAGAIIGAFTPLGIYGMPWGGLIGALIGNLALPVFFMAKAGSHFQPSLDYRAEGVRKFFLLLAPVILGFSLPSVVQLITGYFGARYTLGVNTSLDLGNTLMQAPSGIFGQSLALAAFPILAQFYANQRMDMYRDQLSRSLRTVIFLGLPAGALMLALGPQIVQLLYGYGRAAKEANLSDVAASVQVYSFGVFAWCLQPVLMRGFFSAHKTLLPIAIGTAMTALFIAMCQYCVANRLPFLSLAWVTDIAALTLVVVLYFALEKTVGKLDRTGILATGAKSLAGSVVLGVFAYGAFRLFGMASISHSRLVMFFEFLVVMVAGISLYFFVGHRLKMPETSYFDRAIQKLQRRTGRP